MQPPNIALPAVTVARDGAILSFDNLAELKTATPVALANDYFAGLVIFDASGTAHHVIGAVPTAVESTVRRLLRKLLNRRTNVELLVEQAERVSLADAKSKIIEAVRQHQTFWEAAGSISGLERKVKNANSFAAIADVFK